MVTRNHIRPASTRHSHRCNNLKPHALLVGASICRISTACNQHTQCSVGTLLPESHTAYYNFIMNGDNYCSQKIRKNLQN